MIERSAVTALNDPVDGQNVDAIHDRIREAILRGDLAPGEEVSQVKLAGHLGVGRTPLREALRMLQREGLIEMQANRRQRVAGYSLPDLEQLYTLRLPLEATAIRLSVPRLTPEDLADLEGLIAQTVHYAQAEDYERWEDRHRAFHLALVAKAGERTVSLLSQLTDHAERYRRLYTTQAPRGWERGIKEHRAILDAAKAGDRDLAARLLTAHLAQTALSVFELVDAAYEAGALGDVLMDLIGTTTPAELFS